MSRVRKKIHMIREIKGFSQEYMAHKIDISQRTYSKLENGHVKIDLDRLQQIADILEVDLINLLDEKPSALSNHNLVENFGHIYISAKEYIEHLKIEINYLKEQISKLTEILSKRERV